MWSDIFCILCISFLFYREQVLSTLFDGYDAKISPSYFDGKYKYDFIYVNTLLHDQVKFKYFIRNASIYH